MAQTTVSGNCRSRGRHGCGTRSRLSAFGSGSILTNPTDASQQQSKRASAANMQHASYLEIVERATYIYSVVPPGEAFTSSSADRELVFVDCNAINVESVKRMATIFEGTGITFLDGSIVGLPPSETFNPAIYVSAHSEDIASLDKFTNVSTRFGLNIVPLKGDGSGIGDASAVKMAHSGVVKGLLGLFATSILAANESSPSTAEGLLHALQHTQPGLVDFMASLLPQVPPKSYRFVAEMKEVGGFTGGNGSRAFEGLSGIFARIANAQAQTPPGTDIEVLLRFAQDARKLPN
ncbi:hypothetical protein C8F01DRAFT_1179015 [Mycena amicta]|nr:hypothetical protein C8F01DRAFT_1179015 [Mycena amicta]